MREKKNPNSAERLYKFFIYLVLIMLAVSIIIPVAWVFMASIKQNKEFYGNPWTLPEGFYFQNFMGGLFINVNYIVVPIFLMLRDGDNWLKSVIGKSFLLNNLVILAIVYAATALPFTIYLLSGYFSTLAHDYEEAAYIDGAGYSTTMWKIIFPMAKPSIITIILFNFLSFWNEYIISMTLMSSAKGPKTLPVGLLNLMQAQQSAAQYGIMYAGLVIVMLPTLILYICVQNKLTQGMTVGGLKG